MLNATWGDEEGESAAGTPMRCHANDGGGLRGDRAEEGEATRRGGRSPSGWRERFLTILEKPATLEMAGGRVRRSQL